MTLHNSLQPFNAREVTNIENYLENFIALFANDIPVLASA
jgi:hypothetical protein